MNHVDDEAGRRLELIGVYSLNRVIDSMRMMIAAVQATGAPARS